MSDWRSDVIKFWFGLKYEDWWQGAPELDHQIRENFLKLWSEKRQLPVEAFLGDPETALAAVILFDQFPRNMFRGDAEQFATDELALAIAKAAVDKEFDGEMTGFQRNFFYLPYEHREKLGDQNTSVLMQTTTGNPNFIDAARKHQAIIEKFGRFPHRNNMLGRSPRPDEVAAGDVFPW